MSTNNSDDQLNTPCVIGNEVVIYQSQICEILIHIRKPGDIRTPPKIAIISPTFFSRNMVADSVAREITVLVKRVNFQKHDLKSERFGEIFLMKIGCISVKNASICMNGTLMDLIFSGHFSAR